MKLYDKTTTGLRIPHWDHKHRSVKVGVVKDQANHYCARLDHREFPGVVIYYRHNAGHDYPQWAIEIRNREGKAVPFGDDLYYALRDLLAYATTHGMRWGRPRRKSTLRRRKRK